MKTKKSNKAASGGNITDELMTGDLVGMRDDTAHPRGVIGAARWATECATQPVAVLVAVLVLGAGTGGGGALAASAQFGSSGTRAGQFVEPDGIAVEQGDGDVVVLDTVNRRIDEFTSTGRFLLSWGWGVADGRTRMLQQCRANCHTGISGAGAGQLGFAEGVAVDNGPRSSSVGDVYVVDIGNHRVEKFSPSGAFLLTFGGDVNKTAQRRAERAGEDVCPVEPGDACSAGTIGPAPGQFEFVVEGSFVAVGPTGTVYVGDRNRVQEFAANGTFKAQVELLPHPRPTGSNEVGGVSGLVVDAAGDLYVVRNGVAGVVEYEPSGRLLRTLDEQGEPAYPEGPTPTLALNGAGDLFIDDEAERRHRIDEFDPAGAPLASFDTGMEGGLHGISFGDQTGKLYVLDTNSNVMPAIARVRIVSPPDAAPFAVDGSELARWIVREI